ncbi:neuregulin 3 [Homo sapiens]|uniref:Neuregulin 3 n=1 Tax=Homo sapiens TaxID=9606 RepID=R4GNI6_HUMAN|nr:neuregulin 3 [Homo sapiens]KAI4076660.1 neuregulin 3 [Homo sapiens]
MECGIPPTLVCVGRGGGLHTVFQRQKLLYELIATSPFWFHLRSSLQKPLSTFWN